MKNKVFAVFAVIVLCLSLVIPVSAASTNHIFDDTNMIGELSALEAVAQKIEDTYGYSVLLSVVDTVGEEGTYAYCEELYNTKTEKENGIALTYNYGDNKYAFYCAGEAEKIFTVDIQDNTLWGAFAFTETYYDGAIAYFTTVENMLKESVTALPKVEVTEFIPDERTLPLVVDNADVLTDAEEESLTVKLEELGAKYSLEVGVLTVDTYEGKSGQAYVDYYYDYNGYGYGENDDGLMIVFNTGKGDGTRNLSLTTHGTAIELVTDFEIDVIFDTMIPFITDGEIAAAFDTFVSEADSAIDPTTPSYYIPLSIVIGFAVSFIIVKIQASKLKTVRKKVDAADYVANVAITQRYDNFMFKNVSKVEKKSDSDSGGSSTHTSSSGRTHGGGSRNF